MLSTDQGHSVVTPSALTQTEGSGTRASLSKMVFAGFVQTKGSADLLCCRI